MSRGPQRTADPSSSKVGVRDDSKLRVGGRDDSKLKVGVRDDSELRITEIAKVVGPTEFLLCEESKKRPPEKAAHSTAAKERSLESVRDPHKRYPFGTQAGVVDFEHCACANEQSTKRIDLEANSDVVDCI
jgi:hypothetical protein